MTFRQIGIPAGKVIDRIESERAAVKVAQGIWDGEAPLGGDASPLRSALDIKDCGSPAHAGGTLAELPTLFADAPAPSGSGMEKDRSGEAPASRAQGVRQTEGETALQGPETGRLMLIVSKEGRTAYPPQGRSPRPAVRLSLVMDCGRDHHRTRLPSTVQHSGMDL